jgi:8-oxo-dGTP pyrophosphatase MutT (NUDIX family)
MINFKTENGVFNFRVAGILFHEDKVLIHRLVRDDFYAFPGGRVEMFESTDKTIVREMKEELGIDVEIIRLLWVCEHFFNHNQSEYHEICFYYLIDCNYESFYDKEDIFYITEGENQFQFKWVPISSIGDEPLYPVFIKKSLMNLPTSVERITDDDRANQK